MFDLIDDSSQSFRAICLVPTGYHPVVDVNVENTFRTLGPGVIILLKTNIWYNYNILNYLL